MPETADHDLEGPVAAARPTPVPGNGPSGLPVIYHPAYSTYSFGTNHPANPQKREMLLDLFRALGTPLSSLEPSPATDDDLLTVHTSEYIHAVASASDLIWAPGALRFGLDTDDVPLFPGMDGAARLQVGGTLEAARLIADRRASRVLQLGGGFHHAMPARAAGFCIYNDLSIAMMYLRSRRLRPACIDIDVHHGDGVQWIHYRDPDVLAISIHESGRYLFPNTGFPGERGERNGLGTTINIPLEQHTDDASYLRVFEQVVPQALEQFAPDVLVIPCGVDAHYRDPLGHLMLSTHGFQRLFALLIDYADRFASGRVLFTLGGGYDPSSAIRNWAILIHLLCGWPLPHALPAPWIEAHTDRLAGGATLQLHDDLAHRPPIPHRDEMERVNQETARHVLELMEL